MNWKPFSRKQLQAISTSTARINAFDGPVRSGKTISQIVRWIAYIREAPYDRLLMTGKTKDTIRRNVLDDMFAILGKKNYRWNASDGVIHVFGKTIHVVGANDEKSESRIRGMTVGGWLADEITLYPESFVKMALSRMSVEGAKAFWTMNPDSPFHYIYTEYLTNETLLNTGIIKRFQFQLEDNLSLSSEFVDSIKLLYKGLWYKRYILGQWVQAEGAIYDMFDTERHIVDVLPQLSRYWVSIDYGTTNPFVALLIGLGTGLDGNPALYVVDEWRWDSAAKGRQLTDVEYSREVRKFINKHGITPHRVYYDPSAASFGIQLWRDKVPNVTAADNDVLDGIRATANLIGAGRLFFHRRCEGLIAEMTSYVWDPKAQQRGEDKPLEVNDHGCDALRYCINRTRNTWRKWIANEEVAA